MSDRLATDEALLSVEIAGIKFKNPVLTASGTFGYGLEFANLIDLNRLGGFCSKGLSPRPMKGNPPPRIVETYGAMINAIGLQNIGARAFVLEKLPKLKDYNTRVIANVFGYSIQDYVEAIEILNDGEGIDAYELNISCPNVKEGGIVIGSSPKSSAEVTEVVKTAAKRPVIVKLSPNVTDIKELARAVESAGADAISMINTLVAMSIDVYTRRPRIANVTGGLSGPAIKPIAVRMVYEAKQVVSIPIIGIGGIANWMDAAEFLIAGASAVQIGTANYYDPHCCIKVIDGLATYCREQKVGSIVDLVNSLQSV
ncbi:MAG: dihydroorotate dehydrogenase [Blastocatellia bacterium]|nr:dihydroorotate dehydrogenase [Blastocatellia bacterium]